MDFWACLDAVIREILDVVTQSKVVGSPGVPKIGTRQFSLSIGVNATRVVYNRELCLSIVKITILANFTEIARALRSLPTPFQLVTNGASHALSDGASGPMM